MTTAAGRNFGLTVAGVGVAMRAATRKSALASGLPEIFGVLMTTGVGVGFCRDGGAAPTAVTVTAGTAATTKAGGDANKAR